MFHNFIAKKVFAQLKVAHSFSSKICITKTISPEDLEIFAKLTGDKNHIHFPNNVNVVPIVHGALLNGLVSGVIGTQCPGHGSIVVSQSFTFPNKCYTGKPISINVEVMDMRKIMKIKYWCEQDNKIVFTGDAKVIMNKEH